MNDTATRPNRADVDVRALGLDLVAGVARYLAQQHHASATRLDTSATAGVVHDALTTPAPALRSGDAAPVTLPQGLWRVLPDRLLSLHPARRGEAVARLRITPAQHLDLTALVLEQWGWARTGARIRTLRGRRCVLGAQRVVFCLGYGTEDTATTAGEHLNAVLRARGIALRYQRWSELPHVGADQVVRVVRAAAAVAATRS